MNTQNRRPLEAHKQLIRTLASVPLIILLVFSLTACDSLGTFDKILANALDVADYLIQEGYIEYTLPSSANPSSAASAEVSGTPIEVFILDVGQGDSILLRSPSGKTMLVDASESKAFPVIEQQLADLDITRLDVVIATHPHSDHIGGMKKVIDAYDIGTFYMPNVTHTTKTFENMIEALENKPKTKVVAAEAGKLISWDDEVEVRILSPFTDEKYSDLNDYSVVIRVKYGNNAIMLTGDAEIHAEEIMLQRLPSEYLTADVLKLGHHGSSTSSSDAFFDAVNPSLAVMSLGEDNSYGHPHEETVALLERTQTPCFRTDLNGTVYLMMDGTEITVYYENGF